MSYRLDRKRNRRIPFRVRALMLLFVVLVVVGTYFAVHIYNNDLAPVSNSQSTQIETIAEGSSVIQVGNQLKKDNIIRSAWAFELYIHTQNLTDKLQAGTYALSSGQSLSNIVSILTHGKVATQLVTILPGRRIDQVRADLINSGFTPQSVDAALNPALYTDLPALAFKPASANTLEGLLWPDSFQKQPNTDPSVIIRESLVEMGQHLTPDVQAAFTAEGLTTYQGVTLASIVLQEVNKPSDQTQVAQVFLSRLKNNMNLGSDVTADYGAIVAGQSPSLTYDSPYNTLLHNGLPPTPISTINSTSLAAATHPADTNWLYFVTGDDGTTHFSTNLADHQAQTSQYCHKLCGN